MGKLIGKSSKGLKICLGAIIVFAFLIIFACNAIAEGATDTEFRLEMDNLNMQIGVSSYLTLTIINAQGAKITGIAGIDDFDVLSQNSGTSINMINGQSSFQENRQYIIMPKTAGMFFLKAIIEYQGQTYETNTLQVKVAESSSSEKAAEADLFVTTKLSKAEAYLGEKLIITYELYTRYNIENYGFTDYTSIEGIIAKDIPQDQLKNEYVYLDGVRYAKYEVKTLILDPIKAGAHIIPSFNMQVNVITDNGFGSAFGSFGNFFNSSQPMYLQTEEKELLIKTLPQAKKPANYSGLVGQLQLEGSFSSEEVEYGDSLLLTVKASGNCNLDSLKKIFSASLPGFTVYETQKNMSESVIANQYYTQKDFEIILVPEKTGAIKIAPLAIPFFEPTSGEYMQANIEGATIQVHGEMPLLSNSLSGGPAQTLETVKITQVNYQSASPGYFTIRLKKPVLYIALLGLAALLLAMLAILLLLKRKQQDTTMKSLYRQLLATQDINEAYRLFSEMIKYRYNLRIKASPQYAIKNSLPQTELAAQVIEIMDYMESGEKDCSYLKDKVKGVYRIIL
ncbi:MAG: BatD family protein [Firmicutes bacterium]|nr:BatD family protein [Bacillota bacterium]